MRKLTTYRGLVSKILTVSILFPPLSALGSIDDNLIFEGFRTTMTECPQRIWPNYNWKGVEVVLVTKDSKDALVWNGSNSSISKLSKETLPESFLTTSFSFADRNGKPTMILTETDEKSDSISMFKLGIHEFFHRMGQSTWSTEPTQVRGTLYPQLYQPRIYRRMIFDRLVEFLNSNGKNQTALGQASFWFKTWKNENSDEALNTTDAYEGTAAYVEEIADSVRKLGCSVQESELLNETLAGFFKNRGYSVQAIHFDLSIEGYDVGGLSSLILRFFYKNSGWENIVASGKTPLEILLENVQPLSDDIPIELPEKFKKLASTMNAEIGQMVDKDIESASSKNPLFISLPPTMLQVNIGPKYFVLSKKLPGVMILPMANELSFKSQGTALSSSIGKVYFLDRNNPCGEGLSTLAAVPNLDVTKGATSLDSNGMKGSIHFKKIRNRSGTWLCAE